MLDLEAIFNPDVIEAELAARQRRTVRPLAPEDLPPEWHILWDERAAIMEYDGGLPREHAEAQAMAETIRLMEREAAGRTGCSFQNG
ncbi:MAG: hypothetical protein WBD75_02030 [Phycisphaerae bacterium]